MFGNMAANDNFLLMQKAGATTATSTEYWGIYLTEMPMLNGRERKEMEANDWLDEHGDDPYFGQTIYFKAFDATMKMACAGTMTTIQESIASLLSYLTTGGTRLMIWSEWVKRGRTAVSFVSISEPKYDATKGDNLPFVAEFSLTLHVSDPYTNVTCSNAGVGYILAEATREVSSVVYSNLAAFLTARNTASAAAGSTATLNLTVTAKKTTTYTDGSTEVQNGIVVTPSHVVYTSSDTSVATVSSAGVVTFPSANTSTSTRKSVTITANVEFNSLSATATATAYQSYTSVTYYAYYGSSESVPSSVSTTNSKVLSGTTSVSVTTTTGNRKKCHWVAFPTASGYHLVSVEDRDGDDLSASCTTSVVGDYTLIAMSSAAYIGNTTKFTLAK